MNIVNDQFKCAVIEFTFWHQNKSLETNFIAYICKWIPHKTRFVIKKCNQMVFFFRFYFFFSFSFMSVSVEHYFDFSKFHFSYFIIHPRIDTIIFYFYFFMAFLFHLVFILRLQCSTSGKNRTSTLYFVIGMMTWWKKNRKQSVVHPYGTVWDGMEWLWYKNNNNVHLQFRWQLKIISIWEVYCWCNTITVIASELRTVKTKRTKKKIIDWSGASGGALTLPRSAEIM